MLMRQIMGTATTNVCAGLLLSIFYLPCVRLATQSEVSNEAVHDDPFVIYPYRLTSTSPFGRISDSAFPGSEVPVDTTLPHFEFTESTRFLQLKLTLNTRYLDETGSNNTKFQNAKLNKPSLITKGNAHSGKGTVPGIGPGSGTAGSPVVATLPEGIRIDISEEEGNIAKINERMAFTLDEHLHIVVGNSHGLKDVDGIEFWVVAILQHKGRRDSVVSNPLSFVIKIDHDQIQGHGAALYAGIVVVVVCIFALLIPLTVRTKRRLRQGKPICACGSSSKKLEEQKRKTAETRNGIDVVVTSGEKPTEDQENLAVILEGRQTGREHETIQSRNIRSASVLHFQPRALDPHYNEVYGRPEFKQLTPIPSPKLSSPRVSFAGDSAEASTSKSGEQQSKL